MRRGLRRDWVLVVDMVILVAGGVKGTYDLGDNAYSIFIQD
jgi:hypothetical protein